MKTLKLGSSVTVLDPCYIPNSDHMWHEIGITPGEWFPYWQLSDEGAWGERVSKLGIYLCDSKKNYRFGGMFNFVGYAGVDSGQMMIIDTDAISNWEDTEYDDTSKGELSYGVACQITLSDLKGGTLEDLAVVSSSGLGDGLYPIKTFEDELGRVIRIEVDFELENEEDDLEDEW